MSNVNLSQITGDITHIQPQGVFYPAAAQTDSFQKILENKIEADLGAVRFSKHANLRLLSRDINLSGEQLSRVESGCVKAMEKGIKDSLVLVDGVALLINVKSRTVITAVSGEKQNIFTNIDGAVIV